MKKYILVVLILLSILLHPVFADVVNVSNISIQERIYYTETYAVPFELFVVLIALAFTFLIFSVVSDRAIIPFSMVSFMLFLASAYSAPMVGFITYETMTINGTYNVVPYVSFVGQPWMMFLLYGFALIAFINIWRGVLEGMKGVKERRMGDI